VGATGGLPNLGNSRKLGENAMIGDATATGAAPMFEWIGDDDALRLSY
jgi:hypothetical protein